MYYRIRYVLDNFATVKEAVEGLPGLPGLSELRTIRDPVCEGATSLPHEEGIVLGGHMAIEVPVVTRQSLSTSMARGKYIIVVQMLSS